MTVREIAMLAEKGKTALSISPNIWFQRICGFPGVVLVKMSPSVLIASTILPDVPPVDSVDRILIATAREFGYTLATRDGRIVEYGRGGHVRVLGC